VIASDIAIIERQRNFLVSDGKLTSKNARSLIPQLVSIRIALPETDSTSTDLNRPKADGHQAKLRSVCSQSVYSSNQTSPSKPAL
jgi:hypothetical protein